MIEIQGLHNSALCYTPALEPTAELQIKTVCDQEAFAGCKIRIMPDVHAGKGCTIGTTMTILDKIVPGMVGVDIGCGMETVRLAEKEIDFAALDALIRKEIPCGQNIRKDEHPLTGEIDLHRLRCSPYVSVERAKRSIGTLGGGNHFIEVDRGENGELYLVIHSGSRHLGTQVCKYYQDQGRFAMWGGARHQIDELIAEYRAAGRWKEIQSTINELRREHPIRIPKDLAYVEGKLFEVAKRFIPKSLPLTEYPEEKDTLCVGIFGAQESFYTMKSIANTIAESMDIQFAYEKEEKSFLHPYQTVAIFCEGEKIGYFGKLAYDIQNELNMRTGAFLMEIDLDLLSAWYGKKRVFSSLSKYAEEKRDLAFVMDKEITFGQVEDCIRRANKYIKEIRLFDVYEGGQIPEGKKSMAYTITFAPKEEAFNAEEVQKFVDKICRTLKNDLDIDLRA